jgi:hypothetical protein
MRQISAMVILRSQPLRVHKSPQEQDPAVLTRSPFDESPISAAPPYKSVAVGASLAVQEVTPVKVGGKFVYAAKFLCSRVLSELVPPNLIPEPENPNLATSDFELAPGTYLSTINVLNLASSSSTLTVTTTLLAPGFVQISDTVTLEGDRGFSLSCSDLKIVSGEGFITIRSAVELKVVGVYTLNSVWKVVDKGWLGMVP